MRFLHSGRLVALFALFAAATVGGCRRAIVIVPQPDRAYTERDTLFGYHKGNRVVISFRFDSVLRVDTVTKLDTLWRGGTRTIVRVDTVRVPAPAPAPTPVPVPVPTRVPTRPGTPGPVTPAPVGSGRVDTVVVVRRDTVVVTRRDTVRVGARDTIRITVRDTIRITLRDTIRLTVRDTLFRRDTVYQRDTVFRSDTIRVAGRRTLFVPPGQYPPAGQCRVWIYDLPPGRQADAVPCGSLGDIPAGAFILFGADAWDADFDWVAESRRGSSVPPEIIAVSRRRRP